MTDPQPWIAHAPGRPIAQVLSHLGSQAEIFGLFLDTAFTGAEPPAPDHFPAIWSVWDAKSPDDQARDGLAADRAFRERVEAMPPDDGVRLETDETASGDAVALPAEALVRLVYGRLDPAHTPPIDAAPTALKRLRATFPGP